MQEKDGFLEAPPYGELKKEIYKRNGIDKYVYFLKP